MVDLRIFISQLLSMGLLVFCLLLVACVGKRVDTSSSSSFASSGDLCVPLRNAAQPNTCMPVVGLGFGSYGQLVNGTVKFGERWDDDIARKATVAFTQLGGRRLDTSLKW
jgi:hypothetical protein